MCPFRGALGTRLMQCGLRGGLLPYQVASSSIQPFGHNSVGCHSLRRNISMNYYFVVEMHTVTVRSDDARYLLKNLTSCLVQTTKLSCRYQILPLKLSKFSIKILIAPAIKNATYL